jgi:hypothetical protein
MQLNFQKTGGSYGAGNLIEHLSINRLPLRGKIGYRIANGVGVQMILDWELRPY